MRILAIRGENLASLAAPFDIDLDRGPLGDTGMFAITGETGAGKSTILDALCLALYGQFPRVSAARREEVPDPSGQPMASGDPRAILRRGAGEGFAEVDFIGRVGIGYRARWTVYRARGRADGRLQNEGRSLSRIEDGAPIATGKTAVLAAVEAATDLTFEQFRRTVVLAQGEFDTFLLASEADRAELLEKITGTAVYSEISKRVHAGTEVQRATHAALVARHEAIGLLDAGDRDARLVEVKAIEDAMPGLVAEQAALASALDHSRRLAAAETQLAEAAARADEAAALVRAGDADAARLAELDAVEPLRRAADAVASSRDTLAAAAELRDRAQADVEAAEAGLAEARAGHVTARAAAEAVEADVRAFAPAWSAAEVLDAQLAGLDREAEAANVNAMEAGAGFEAARIRRIGLSRAQDALVAGLAEVAQRMDADAMAEPLAVKAAEIAGMFDKRATLTSRIAAARLAFTDAEAAVAAADAATAVARDRVTSAREARSRLMAARATIEVERRGLDVEVAEARDAHLRELLARLSTAGDLMLRLGRVEAEIGRARASGEQATTARDMAAARRVAAEAAQSQAARGRAEIVTLADLAERSASAEAAHMRIALIQGRPCPVCGSADHPVAHGDHGTDELALLAEALRARRAFIDAEIAGAGSDIAAAIADEAGATARLETATREGDEAAVRLSNDALAYAELLPGLTSSCGAAGLAPVPPLGPGPEASLHLDAMIDAARSARSTVAGVLERVRGLDGEIRAQGRSIEAAEGEIVTAEGIIAGKAGPRHEAALLAAGGRSLVGELLDRVESLDRELGPYLVVAGLDLADLDRDPHATASRVARIGAAYRDLRDRHGILKGELDAGSPLLAVAVEAEATATIARDGAERAAGDRAEALKDARRRRAGLLGGEPTGIHRARINAVSDTARAALRAADEAVGSAIAVHASASGANEHSLAQFRRATELSRHARERFMTECGDRAPDAVMILLAVPPGTRLALRDARDRLLRGHEAAVAALATRRADVDGLRARPAIDVPGTEAAVARIADLVAANQRRHGALDAELARDDAARGQAANLSGEIEAAREGLGHWEMVDAAVGSAGGDRFRRFAQGVTLEHLARLANEQLNVLSPRYRLVRSRAAELSLHVLDRDMGDELRGTRSLSGGERFLVALALALALSGLEGRQAFVDTLFIDEGFGSLDAETLDVAVDALETLRGQGRRVGVITHVAAMIDRIAVQVRVERRGNGRSVVRVTDGILPG
ncbi:AAA family ATPase [Methylobacterium sp. J-088]|uniref:AAA family ATPase n=1 Tax=Methylobacterium sp. J-088 TaxID=2836664 RepID=UPI001FB999B9|nr:AAA family ATPase [Methylobacterium sp. J-088]MCJ2065997.1 AAA family ATPase [Methylobacterium sp. J-088]